MKTLLAIIMTVLLAAPAFSQALTVGDQAPDLLFTNGILLGKPNTVENRTLSQFAGKIVIIDFWATWCGPCIASIPKYEALQQEFAADVQVIGVTHETVKRIQRFVKNRPVGFMLAVDTASALRTYFDYRTIPHVVILGKTGKVLAITNSQHVTETVIRDLLQGHAVSLPLKKDRTDFDYERDYFQADSTTREAFTIQAGLDGVGSMSKVGKGVFENRRISMINFTLDGLYRMAYQASYYRVQNQLDPALFDYRNMRNRYCVDVIVPAGKDVHAYMQEQLPKHFEIKARWEKKKVPVTVLKRAPGPLAFEPVAEKSKYYGASSNHFTGTGVTLAMLAEYFESFGIMNTPVVDETGLAGTYAIQLEWQPEKKGHMEEVFRKAGIEWVKAEREIEVLVLYR